MYISYNIVMLSDRKIIELLLCPSDNGFTWLWTEKLENGKL